VIHKRASGSYNTVGAKPYTTCTAGTPTSISHSSTLYKARWLGLNWEAMVTKTNSNTYSSSLTLKTVEWRCKNSNGSCSKGPRPTAGTTTCGAPTGSPR